MAIYPLGPGGGGGAGGPVYAVDVIGLADIAISGSADDLEAGTVALARLAGVPVFIQSTQPSLPAGQKYLWIDTTGGDVAIKFENGI